MSDQPPVLEMRGITKRFPTGTLANDAIDLDVRRGEIHALLGENGAGKSTLMNILYGLVPPDTGQVLIDGHPVTIRDPADAIARGIGMVHQHFMLVPVLSVAENVVLGNEIVRAGQLLDIDEAAKQIKLFAGKLGFDIDPFGRIDQLSVGQQQRVEILKAIYRNARILVLDEPTAVLTPQETREIFEVFRRLRSEGASVIFISHKLDEVLEIADRITVIRRGKVVGSRKPKETNENELAELMVGRAVNLRVDRGRSHPGEIALEVAGLRAKDDRGHEALRGLDLVVRAGEIVGIAGVAGNGQDEIVESLMGLRRRPPERSGSPAKTSPERRWTSAGIVGCRSSRRIVSASVSSSPTPSTTTWPSRGMRILRSRAGSRASCATSARSRRTRSASSRSSTSARPGRRPWRRRSPAATNRR